jgi:hypothetical protein
MDRRTFLRVTGLGVAAGGLAGCGIATHGGIVVDGNGPAAVGSATGAVPTRPTRSQADPPLQLVQDFLYQPAGDDGPDQALARCRSYHLGGGRSWTPTNDITVVWFDEADLLRQEPTKDGDTLIVAVELFPLGTFKDGRVEPLASGVKSKFTAEFRIADAYILDIKLQGGPNTLLLSSAALANLYTYRNLYYWSVTSPNELVPDARYLYAPTLKPQEQMIDMLLAGPSPWLADLVKPLPTNVELKGTPIIDGGKIIVNLTQPAAKETDTPKKLVAQLTWNLLDEATEITTSDSSPIQVKVESVAVKVDGTVPYKQFNPNVSRQARPRQWFAIVDGKVRQLRMGDSGPERIRFLEDPAINQNVVQAACIARRDAPEQPAAFALVRTDGGHHKLLVIPATDASDAPRQITFASSVRTMLRPIFVNQNDLLVVADGSLYHVRRLAPEAPVRVSIPDFGGVKILAFALSPEGRRIALVTSSGLYLAPLTRLVNGKITIDRAPERVPTILSAMSGVGFTGESWLAVAGTFNGKVGIAEISLDGALVGRPGGSSPWLMYNAGLPTVTSLMAYPENPDPAQVSVGRVVYTANGRAYETATNELASELVTRSDGVKPINPFFME